MKNAVLFLFLLFVEGVFMESVSVKEGDSVTLHADLPEIKKSYVIDWRIGGTLIVRLNKEADKTTYGEMQFKNYKLNDQTGDLIITNIRTEQAGEYEVSDTIYFKKFNVTVSAGERQSVSVMEGESVTLYTDVTETQNYDVIRWRFRGSPIAEINRNSNNIPKYDVPDGSFRNQLQLNGSTGSLTIKNIEKNHSGGYDVDIIRSRHTIHKSFTVTVTVSGKNITQSVKAGESLTLYTGLTEIQSYDFILWKTRNTDLAEIYKAEGRLKIYDGPDGRFRDRLKLDHQTGSLTIMNTRITDEGEYKLQISSSRHVIHKRFSVMVTESGLSPAVKAVIVVLSLLVLGAVVAASAYVIYNRRRISTIKSQTHYAKTETVTAGNSVTLYTGVIVLQSTDVVMWLFGDQDNLIARIKGGENSTPYYDESFRDSNQVQRLDLSKESGSLTITNTTIADSGRYKVKIDRSGKHTSQLFILSVINPTPNEVNGREETQAPLISQP